MSSPLRSQPSTEHPASSTFSSAHDSKRVPATQNTELGTRNPEPIPAPARPEPILPTGIKPLDQLLRGGLPLGTISEFTGSFSSGKTSLLFTLLAATTSEHFRVAYIDTFDTFDPHFARTAGIQLQRLLWIRCQGDSLLNKVRNSLKTADILTRSQDFRVIVLDLEPASNQGREANVQKIPFHCWFRIKKVLQGKKVAFFLLSHNPCAGSAATTVLGLDRSSVRWRSTRHKSHPLLSNQFQLLRGLTTRVSLLRGRHHGHVKIHCHLQL